MKFSEIPYERPDMKQVMDNIDELTRKFSNASSADEQYAVPMLQSILLQCTLLPQ